MHHSKEVAATHTRVEVDHHNTDDGGNFVVLYLWVGPQIAGTVSLNLHGEFITDASAEAIVEASRSALLDYWSL